MKILVLLLICLLSQTVLSNEYNDRSSDYLTIVDEYHLPRSTAPPPILPPALTIVIDKSEFLLTVMSDGATLSTHKVIIGSLNHPTPTISTTLSRIIINPIWEVPDTLLYKLVNDIRQHDPISYIKQYKFELYSNNIKLDPSTINWNILSKTGPYNFRIIQQPGINNFIGQVIFVLETTTEIQMHDTPNKQLFLQKNRNFSSGCIRVERSIELAELILRQKIDSIVIRNDTVVYELPRAVTVLIID